MTTMPISTLGICRMQHTLVENQSIAYESAPMYAIDAQNVAKYHVSYFGLRQSGTVYSNSFR